MRSEKRTVIYARVSTRAQKKNGSLDRQVEYCRNYAESIGIYNATIVREVSSGEVLWKRPGLMRGVYEPASRGEIDLVIYEHEDRLARTMKVMQFYDDMKRFGVVLKRVPNATFDRIEREFVRDYLPRLIHELRNSEYREGRYP